MSIYFWKPIVVSDMQWPCADWFHVPLRTEWKGLYDIWVAIWAWTSSGGDNIKNYLHLPFTWYRQYLSTVLYQGEYGYYWSSSAYNDNGSSYYLSLGPSSLSPQSTSMRASWFTIRAFKNTFVAPTASWTTIYQWTWNAGIFYNSSDWIITITSDGSTWYTIADKNEWATVVYNNWDALSESNCWKYFQWGNNYWFPFTWSVTTSSTAVNAWTYWPWNYYSSSTWITASPRDSANNKNLRWWVSQWTSTVNKDVKNIYVWINVPDYTVQRKNRDNTVLETDLNVMEWTTPTYNWATPTRSGYTFSNWSPTPAPIYADTDYTAQFVELPYLCFTAKTINSTVQLVKNGSPTSVTLETSTDGITRTTYTFGTQIVLTNIWDKVYFRNTSATTTWFSIDTYPQAYYQFVMSWWIYWSWNITYLLNKNWTTTVWNSNFVRLFYQCNSLFTPPELPATTLGVSCYTYMFMNCANLAALPKLPASVLPTSCYVGMFANCSNIKLSTTKTWAYQTAYRIPTSLSWTDNNSLTNMFNGTWWTFVWTPTINTTYYTSNTVV